MSGSIRLKESLSWDGKAGRTASCSELAGGLRSSDSSAGAAEAIGSSRRCPPAALRRFWSHVTTAVLEGPSRWKTCGCRHRDRSAEGVPAVHHDGLAGDVRSILRREERDNPGDP